MDTKKMCDLATYIETRAGKFDMSNWISHKDANLESIEAVGNDCNTAACVAGWCALAHGKQLGVFEFFSFGRITLGLTEEEAFALFTPDGYKTSIGLGKEARDRAVMVLRGQIPLDENWLSAKLPASE